MARSCTLVLTLWLVIKLVAGQWNLNVGPGMSNNFQGGGPGGQMPPPPQRPPPNNLINTGPGFPSSASFFADPRAFSANNNRPDSMGSNDWSWTNGPGANFATSGGGGFAPQQSAASSSFNSIGTPYYGTRIGSLSTYQHGVSGDVYAVDDETVLVKRLMYDGQIADASFYIGSSETVQPFQGILLADAQGQKRPLIRSDGQDMVLKLNSGGNLRAYRWLAVLSTSQNANFGDVMFPRDFSPPKPVSLGAIEPSGYLPQQNVRSGTVTIINDKQIQVMNFFYDGQAPDAFFWAGQGPQPSSQGTIVPYQNSYSKLPAINGQTITLTLPGNFNIQNVNWLSVWSRTLNTNLGHVMIPSGLNVPPTLVGTTQRSPPTANLMDLPNCEIYGGGTLQVRWSIHGQDLLVQLKGRIEDRQYMAFGLSGTQNRVSMDGSDVVVAYWDSSSNSAMAMDYILTSKQECDGITGVCPDSTSEGGNSIEMISGSRNDGYTTVVYRRRINTGDRLDLVVNPSVDTYIVWAVGPLNNRNQPAKHFDGLRASTEQNENIRFGRVPADNCPTLLGSSAGTLLGDSVSMASSSASATWKPQYVYGNETKTFVAVIGPSGGKKGFVAITGKPTWGIVWYINGKMAPELVLRRGETYRFIVYGGMYAQAAQQYHPFYITTDSRGGLGSTALSEQVRQMNTTIAGVRRLPDGIFAPTAVGPYCAFVQQGATDPDTFQTFEEFNRTLRLQCSDSPPGYFPSRDRDDVGILEWTPSYRDPASLYYQCFVHRDMGWKITLVNDYRELNSPIQQLQLQPANGQRPALFSTKSRNSSGHLRGELTAALLLALFAFFVKR